MKFDHWFKEKLIVGAFPYKEEEHFNAFRYKYVINVSDEWYPEVEGRLHAAKCRTYWFAMSEQRRDMGLNSIYCAMVVLRQAEREGEYVYLHCHAGTNRSPTVQAAYHYFRTGSHMMQELRSVGFINKLDANCSRGYLPPMAEMEKFLRAIAEDLKGPMLPGTLTMAKIHHIHNF